MQPGKRGGLDLSRRWARLLEQAGQSKASAVAACVVAVAGVVAGVTWLMHAVARANATRVELAEMLAAATASGVRPSVLSATLARADFVSRLPQAVNSADLLHTAHDAAGRASVSIVSAQLQETPPSVEKLGRTELTLNALGSYANLKGWLGELTGRWPNATVARLRSVDSALVLVPIAT